MTKSFEAVIRTEADLHALWRKLMGHDGFSMRSLWLIFLEQDGRTQPLIVPIDDLPDEPHQGFLDGLRRIVSGLITEGVAASVAVLLSRPGHGPMTEADRRWARGLRATLGSEFGRWPVHLATHDQVRVFAPTRSDAAALAPDRPAPAPPIRPSPFSGAEMTTFSPEYWSTEHPTRAG